MPSTNATSSPAAPNPLKTLSNLGVLNVAIPRPGWIFHETLHIFLLCKGCPNSFPSKHKMAFQKHWNIISFIGATRKHIVDARSSKPFKNVVKFRCFWSDAPAAGLVSSRNVTFLHIVDARCSKPFKNVVKFRCFEVTLPRPDWFSSETLPFLL